LQRDGWFLAGAAVVAHRDTVLIDSHGSAAVHAVRHVWLSAGGARGVSRKTVAARRSRQTEHHLRPLWSTLTRALRRDDRSATSTLA
jgi:hypothetical protein